MNPVDVAPGDDVHAKVRLVRVTSGDPFVPHYAIPDSELSLTRNRLVQDFTITTDSYILLCNHLYEALCAENAKFADRVSESAFQYYAVMLLWQRLGQFLSPQSRRSSAFLEQLSSLEPYLTGIPKPLEIYLKGIGNFKHPYFGEMRFKLPEVLVSGIFNLDTGAFGKVTADTHFLYEAFPAPGIAALRILIDVSEKYLDHPIWDLPKSLRPDFEDYSAAEGRADSALRRPMPTKNLLGWAPAQRLTSEQFKLFQDSNIGSNHPHNDLPAFFKNSHKLLAAIAAYFDDTKYPFMKPSFSSNGWNQLGKNPATSFTLTNSNNSIAKSPCQSSIPTNSRPLDKSANDFFSSIKSSKPAAKPNIQTSASTNASNTSVKNSPKSFGSSDSSNQFTGVFAEGSQKVINTPSTFNFAPSVQANPKGTSVSPKQQLQSQSEGPESDFFKSFGGFTKVKRLPFEGSTIQGLVVERAAESSGFDRYRMYCDGKVSVHSSWKVNDMLATGAVIAGYRMPKEMIHNQHSWSCYDFNEYQRVPESWISTRNSIYMFGGTEGINIRMWSSGTTEKRLTQYAFLKKHMMVSGSTWNSYM